MRKHVFKFPGTATCILLSLATPFLVSGQTTTADPKVINTDAQIMDALRQYTYFEYEEAENPDVTVENKLAADLQKALGGRVERAVIDDLFKYRDEKQFAYNWSKFGRNCHWIWIGISLRKLIPSRLPRISKLA
jgi:hypothetical protein